MADRQHFTGESPFEEPIGFSRALRVGNRVLVSGTGPTWADGSCDPDPEVQAARCFELIANALALAGAGVADIVRTRMFIVDADDAGAVGAAHSHEMAGVRPAATMVVVAALLDPRWKVEIEAEALLGDG